MMPVTCNECGCDINADNIGAFGLAYTDGYMRPERICRDCMARLSPNDIDNNPVPTTPRADDIPTPED